MVLLISSNAKLDKSLNLSRFYFHNYSTYWNHYLREKQAQGHYKNLLGLTTDTLKQMSGQNIQSMHCR